MNLEQIRIEGSSILEEIKQGINQLDFSQIEIVINEIQAAKRIFCLGAGRSGIMLQAFCMRLNHLGLQAFMLGTIPCPPAEPGDLVIAASGSGETVGVLAILQKAKKLGVRTIVITTSNNSEISACADMVIRICAPKELVNDNSQSNQPMRTLFEQVSFIIYELIITILKKRQHISEEEMAKRHANLE